MTDTKLADKKFCCPLCHKFKEHAVKISVEFPNPLISKYPEVVFEPYTCEMSYCHTCVFKIFKATMPTMHEELRDMIESDDTEIENAYKHGKLECAECGTRMDDKHTLSCEEKEDLR